MRNSYVLEAKFLDTTEKERRCICLTILRHAQRFYVRREYKAKFLLKNKKEKDV
jgi:hypothetical protein